jgi:ABC-type transporter lipoprotein component MlaA
MSEFTFRVNLVAVVRVRAANESVARLVVPTVLGASGSIEIASVHQNNVLLGRDAVVTGVDFSMIGPIKSSKS